jgi:hypothetical protein
MASIVKDKNPNAEEVKLVHGVTNKNYKGRRVNSTLGRDMSTLQKVFNIFNVEFFDGALDVPAIMISDSARVEYKVLKMPNWKKQKGNIVENELMKMVMSEIIYKYETKEIYITLVKAMILQYDLEMDEVYRINGEKRTRLINNNNNYFSEVYYAKCKEVGLVPEEITEDMKSWDEDEIQQIKSESQNEEEERQKQEVRYHNRLQRGKVKMKPTEIFNRVYNKYEIETKYQLIHKDERKETKGTQSMRLLECPNCGMTIRITKKGNFDIRCFNIYRDKEGNEIPCNGARFVDAMDVDRSKRGKKS